jgi:hypothetical protein
LDLRSTITRLSQKRPIFHNEADFQHALAWEIREHFPDAKIRLEMKIHGANTKVYLDILVDHEGRKYAIELKYKTRTFDCLIDGEEFSLNNHGAQDTGRYDVLKDLHRLERMVADGVVDDGFLIFLTNDASYYLRPGEERQTADLDFRTHEGRRVHGQLSWGDKTGQGTMRGREEPLSFQGQYHIRWASYSQVGDTSTGEFRYLMLSVPGVQPEFSEVRSFSPVITATAKVEDDVIIMNNTQKGCEPAKSWFDSFSQRGEIPLSQVDLRDKLANYLRHIGYTVFVNHELGKDKIDIWAGKDNETIAVEVRYKTSLLQTIHQGKHIHLKNQLAQDISRYDFISDIGKLERVVKKRPDVKGFALLLTNDSLYRQPPKKHNPVDEEFRIHDDRLVTGLCSWKEQASSGTISGREEGIYLTGTYRLTWRPHLTLGVKKNEQFEALLVEVTHRYESK